MAQRPSLGVWTDHHPAAGCLPGLSRADSPGRDRSAAEEVPIGIKGGEFAVGKVQVSSSGGFPFTVDLGEDRRGSFGLKKIKKINIFVGLHF